MNGMPQSLAKPLRMIKSNPGLLNPRDRRLGVVGSLTDHQKLDIEKYGVELLKKIDQLKKDLQMAESELAEIRLICPHNKKHGIFDKCAHCGVDCGDQD